MNRKILFTGGGTAGHVTPNLVLIDALNREGGWQIDYAGSVAGIEKLMIERESIPYHEVCSGKLRRYFSWKNFIDPFKILFGVAQSFFLIRRINPDVVFSKGGFVAFPIVAGAWLNRIPVIAHESDISPGLANRLSFPFVVKICMTFEPAKEHFKRKEKLVITGTPIRDELLQGDRQRGLALCNFNNDKPCILVIGGSQGSNIINKCVRNALASLCDAFQIIHVCGKGKVDPTLTHNPAYFQFEYVNKELADLFAASTLVISRSGANSLYEILALRKPHILIPLSRQVSRGDQIQNANYYQQQGVSTMIIEEELTPAALLKAVGEVMEQQDVRIAKMENLNIKSSTEVILQVIKNTISQSETSTELIAGRKKQS